MIAVEHLSKRYATQLAVDDVSFTCEAGTVTGFLGPNGAGKSTTLRMICGLTVPTSGRATVHGVPYSQLPNPGRHIGVLLDASAQHAGRTGKETLTLSAMTLGLDASKVPALLQHVGLDGSAAKKRVGTYSLGMRQRLGIAQALLANPSILILDEPANGLDPQGIHWMRGLLRDFADRGGTVLLSSHLLHEIEAVADRLVVIGGGKIVAQGTKDELLAGRGTYVRGLDADALERTLTGAGLGLTKTSDGGFHVDAEAEDVGRAAATSGVVLLELRQADGARLEDLFLQLTAAPAPQEVAA